MKYYSDLLEEVQDFAHGNLGEKFVITKGRHKGETVTIAGYTGQDGLGGSFHNRGITRYPSNG